MEDNERFSPEKENALQTLDKVIQEVEDSLGKLIWSISNIMLMPPMILTYYSLF